MPPPAPFRVVQPLTTEHLAFAYGQAFSVSSANSWAVLEPDT